MPPCIAAQAACTSLPTHGGVLLWQPLFMFVRHHCNFLGDIAASSSGSNYDSQRYNRKDQCPPHLECHSAEALMEGEALMDSLFLPFYNNRVSSHRSILSPIDLATHCTQRCNQKGKAKLCLLLLVLVELVELSGIPRRSFCSTILFCRKTKALDSCNHTAQK